MAQFKAEAKAAKEAFIAEEKEKLAIIKAVEKRIKDEIKAAAKAEAQARQAEAQAESRPKVEAIQNKIKNYKRFIILILIHTKKTRH